MGMHLEGTSRSVLSVPGAPGHAYRENVHKVVCDAAWGSLPVGGIIGAGPIDCQAAVGVTEGGGRHLDRASLDRARLQITTMIMLYSWSAPFLEHVSPAAESAP